MLAQQNAVHLLRKPRPEGDTGKVADYEAAATDLSQAHRFFQRLRQVGASPPHVILYLSKGFFSSCAFMRTFHRE